MNGKDFNQTTVTIRSPGWQAIVGGLLLVALLAFELFNFDTTRYALQNLLGDVHFWGLPWAAILAIAFCAIDFAGLLRFFMPVGEKGTPKEVWYLMGAWLLGATMNALMTWWAVSLTLLNHSVGNEILSREQLIQMVPFFVAALVWLTRILFIGAFSVAGGFLFEGLWTNKTAVSQPPLRSQPTQPVMTTQPVRQNGRSIPRPAAPPPVPAGNPIPMQAQGREDTF